MCVCVWCGVIVEDPKTESNKERGPARETVLKRGEDGGGQAWARARRDQKATGDTISFFFNVLFSWIRGHVELLQGQSFWLGCPL